MRFLDTTIDTSVHPALVVPVTGHQVQVNPTNSLNSEIAPVFWPNYWGGGAILLGLMGMLIVARASASPVSHRQRKAAEVGKVHHANVLKNLEHRIEVATARGDQNLIHLLQQELHNLG